MYRRVLLALDAKGLAGAALSAVVQLMAGAGGEVRVVHVRGVDGEPRGRGEDQQMIDHAVAGLLAAGIAASGEVRTVSEGGVAGALADSAQQFGADLIAMGSHGRTELGGLVLGSVGHQLASQTECAVMLVQGPAGLPTRRWPTRIQRVLLAVDRSERSEGAVQAALTLSRQHDAAITVLYVEPALEAPSSAQGFVRGIVDRLRRAGVRARAAGLAGMGGVAFQIAQAAERTNADVIVIGSRRRGSLAALILGSVARDLVRETARPVLMAGAAGRSDSTAGAPAANGPPSTARDEGEPGSPAGA